MKQVTQKMRSGEIAVLDVPVPALQDSWVLVRNHASVISAGTEKSKIDLGNKNLLQKARARPDLVRQVIEKIRREGLRKTVRTVTSRLDELSPLGYSCAGEVVAVGGLVQGLNPGDRVACAGADYANHAEINAIPRNLVCKIPDSVSYEDAAFTTIGSIALQGIRLVKPQLGETVLVLGLGLIGQIATQILQANGCKVIGTDLDQNMLELAEKFGASAIPIDRVSDYINNNTNGRGVDAVLICAGTSSNQPIELSGEVTREKGRVVVVGAVRMDIPREPYFKKEIDVTISRSYGPGRYDPNYEENGNDYPAAYVRFTEQRNMQAILELMQARKLNVTSLVSHQFDIDAAADAYKLLEESNKEPYLGIILGFQGSSASDRQTRQWTEISGKKAVTTDIKLSLVGAGNYATSNLLPLIKDAEDCSFIGLLTASGRSAADIADRYGFQYSTSDLSELLTIESNTLMICSRHDTHCEYVVAGLQAGKHVYVEKPLAISVEQLQVIFTALTEAKPHLDKTSVPADENGVDTIRSTGSLMVGFNRRYSPLVQQAMSFLPDSNHRKIISIRVNAGQIPADHWINDPLVGGGRLVGEACHFIDLACTFAQSHIISVHSTLLDNASESPVTNDNFIISLKFADGSIASITYTSDGATSLAKEYIEVFSNGHSVTIDDFKEMTLYRPKGRSGKTVTRTQLPAQDKGQKQMLKSWLDCLKNGSSLIDAETLLNVSLATILAVESAMTGLTLDVNIDHLSQATNKSTQNASA